MSSCVQGQGDPSFRTVIKYHIILYIYIPYNQLCMTTSHGNHDAVTWLQSFVSSEAFFIFLILFFIIKINKFGETEDIFRLTKLHCS